MPIGFAPSIINKNDEFADKYTVALSDTMGVVWTVTYRFPHHRSLTGKLALRKRVFDDKKQALDEYNTSLKNGWSRYTKDDDIFMDNLSINI
jgi:hypothetical protein